MQHLGGHDEFVALVRRPEAGREHLPGVCAAPRREQKGRRSGQGRGGARERRSRPRTWTERSVSSLISLSRRCSEKAVCMSELRFMSVTIPSSLEVNCAPQRSLSFAIIARSASSELLRASSSRLASCFL